MTSNKKQTNIHIKTDFDCVFLLNGNFCEKADGFLYPEAEPLYITVLPLDAHLLPYTTKILNAKAIANADLCTVFKLDDKTYVKLMPRYNYIYNIKDGGGIAFDMCPPQHLFNAIKNKNFAQAKKYLTQNLLSTIDDNALQAFFDPYTAIVKDEFSNSINYANSQNYFLIEPNGAATLFTFELVDGIVDNITNE